MKINQSDYQKLKLLIQGVIKKYGIETLFSYKKAVKEDGKYLNLDKYWRWYLLHTIPLTVKINWLDLVSSYGCQDDHIDTALKKVIKELKL